MTTLEKELALVAVEEGDSDEYEPTQMASEEEIAAAWANIKVVDGEYGLKYHYRIDNEKLICAGRRRNGLPCDRMPAVGRNRCKLHGGASPRGISHPRFKTGENSRDLPSRLAQRYDRAMGDPKLLELRTDIAVVDARVGDLLTRVDSGESGAMWRAVKTLYNDMRAAAQANDQAKFAMLLSELGKIINKGQSDYIVWDEVLKTITARRRLVESERKRLVEMKQMMTAEQAMGMLGFVVNVIKKRTFEIVPGEVGQRLLASISADISRYVANNRPNTDSDDSDD